MRLQNCDSIRHEDGILLLRQMILARAFPNLPAPDRDALLGEAFNELEKYDRLCAISGGHIRNLPVLLYGYLRKQDPSIPRDTLEDIITLQRDSLIKAIHANE